MSSQRIRAALARLLLPARDREFIIGDLDELYRRRLTKEGRLSAGLRYLTDLLGSAVATRRRGSLRPPNPLPTTARPGEILGDTFTDLRHAIRSMRRRPAFAAMVIVTVALGIGPAAVVFGMVNQLLLRPLPGVANSSAAAHLRFYSSERRGELGLSLFDFDELRVSASHLDGIASYSLTTLDVSVDGNRPFQVWANTIYGDFFHVLGVEPSFGRLLAATESGLDADPLVVVISESLRDRVFGPGEDPIGRSLRVGEHSLAVVGVAGGGFRGPEWGERTDAWLPHSALVPLVNFPPEALSSRNYTMHRRLVVLPRTGVTLDAVEDQIAGIIAQIAVGIPEHAEYLSSLRPTVFGGLHTPPLVRDLTNNTLKLMGWAVALILAIACANVANLLLFRNLARRGAIATVRALGASTGRIARQQVTESLLIATLGAVAAIGVAWLIALPFQGWSLARMQAFEGFTLGWRMLGFILTALVGTVIVFGVGPAVFAGRFDLGAALRASQTRETGRVGWLRTALAAGQMGLTLALMVGSLLMVRTVANLHQVETGLNIEGVASVTIDSGDDMTPEERHVLQRALVSALGELPEAQAVALDIYGPHGSRTVGRITLPGGWDPRGEPTLVWQVTPGWFDLFHVEAINGRTFLDSDWRASRQEGIVLTASLARRLFGRTDVAGQLVLAGFGREPIERQVVGVVGDYRSFADPGQPTDAFFVTYGDFRLPLMMLLIKTKSFSPDVVTKIRTVVESILPEVPVPDPVLLSEKVEDILRDENLLGQLLGILSAFGVLMSAVGLYGVIFFVVSHREREFGIRLALGADAVDILRLVGRSALKIVVGGTMVGLVASYWLATALENRLFGLDLIDLTSYAGAAALLGVVAILACVVPARAAVTVDPVTTLRQD